MSSKQIQRETSRESNRTYSEDRSYGDSHYAMDWASVIRFTAPTVGLMAVLSGLIALTLGAGCADKKTALDSSNANLTARTSSDGPQASALQVTPLPASPSAYAPPSQSAAYVPPTGPAAPDPVITQAPTLPATTSTSAAGSSYTVQHGDTLFRIAKEHYGDGKQWVRIVSANPGLTPANLKAGQKIVLP